MASRVSLIAAIVTASVGVFALCGWIWNIDSFKAIEGPITMKTNAAIGLLLCGTALAVRRSSARLSSFCAVAAGVLGALTLSEHLAGWDLGIDQLLFSEAPGAAATASPNRMGLNASTSLVLAGVSLYSLAGRRGTTGVATSQRLAMLSLLLAAIPVAGYLYDAEQLYGLAKYTGIALPTALSFVVLNTGILLARTDVGPVSVCFNEGPAATMLRRLAVPIIGIPLALGYVQIKARDAGLVDRGLGVALYAVAIIIVLGLTVWHTAQVIEVSDRARRRAEHDRDRASRLKDHFLATLSHELRTPLNVMLGWTRILEQRNNADEHPRIAALVAKNGRLLARLVEDLLDLSRVTAGHFEISRAPLNLNAVVQASLDAIGPTAAAKAVTVTADLDPALAPIEADPERIQQIIWNLLSNAVKFTEAGGIIIVRTASAGDAAVLTVADTGIGFDETFSSDLFEPFRQADTSSRRVHGGLGLGLSIARHIAELHGGTLTGASPGVGHGATFTLTLPRSARPAVIFADHARIPEPVDGARL